MSSRDELKEAIAIFVDDYIDRELQYPEFEAVMDGFVPMPEFAAKTVNAVYLTINPHLKITSCVFFTVSFDPKGMIAAKWNVPLQQLAASAAKGPDLGAGPIALACYSQCPIPMQKQNLWDPVMEPGRNSFVLLKKAVAKNRLGLIFLEPEPDPEQEAENNNEKISSALEREYAKVMRTRLAHTLKAQRLHINTLKNQMSLKVDELKREHQQRLAAYHAEIESLKQANSQLQNKIKEQDKALDLKENKLQGIREYYEHKLDALKQNDGVQIEALEQGFEEQLNAHVKELKEQFQQQLDMKELEIFYRQQQEESLREELNKLRAENETLMEHDVSKMLKPLSKAGISFVAYQPGMGQVNLSLEDITEYVSDPVAFAAKQCGVPVETYKMWLDHYQSPYCNARNSEGEECGVGVKRVTHPADFHDGETNRCEAHRSIGGTQVAGRS